MQSLLSDLDRQERSKVRENCKVGSFPTAGSRPPSQPETARKAFSHAWYTTVLASTMVVFAHTRLEIKMWNFLFAIRQNQTNMHDENTAP